MDVWKRTVLLVAVLLGFVLAPAARAWTWPVDGAVLQPFVFDRSHPYAAGQHRGVDDRRVPRAVGHAGLDDHLRLVGVKREGDDLAAADRGFAPAAQADSAGGEVGHFAQ